MVEKLNLPNLTVDMSKEKRWLHLVNINLPSTSRSEVTVPLGADVFDLIVPLEIRTALGWTVTLHLPGLGIAESNHILKTHFFMPDKDLLAQVGDRPTSKKVTVDGIFCYKLITLLNIIGM